MTKPTVVMFFVDFDDPSMNDDVVKELIDAAAGCDYVVFSAYMQKEAPK